MKETQYRPIERGQERASAANYQKALKDTRNLGRPRSLGEKQAELNNFIYRSSPPEKGFVPVSGRVANNLSFHSPNRGYESPFAPHGQPFRRVNHARTDPAVKGNTITNELSNNGSQYFHGKFPDQVQRNHAIDDKMTGTFNKKQEVFLEDYESDNSSINSNDAHFVPKEYMISDHCSGAGINQPPATNIEHETIRFFNADPRTFFSETRHGQEFSIQGQHHPMFNAFAPGPQMPMAPQLPAAAPTMPPMMPSMPPRLERNLPINGESTVQPPIKFGQKDRIGSFNTKRQKIDENSELTKIPQPPKPEMKK